MLADSLQEVIFVGLPGPTHHYGGLSGDNRASSSNRGSLSAPREAALQVLGLMRLLRSLGQTVAILPPQLRPDMELLRLSSLPHETDDALITRLAKEQPALLERASSSSAMWTANAATVAPGIDSTDGRLHIGIANLHSNLHRRIEANATYRILAAIGAGIPDCAVHKPLDSSFGLLDEGAANHTRLAPSQAAKGLHVFVYGTDGAPDDPPTARQTLLASTAMQRQLCIAQEQAVFVKQHPEAIRHGVFHNDVIAVGNGNFLLVHEDAYHCGLDDIARISEQYEHICNDRLIVRIIRRSELSLEEAVQCYFFNSQLITLPDGGMAIIAPQEVRDLYEGKGARLMDGLIGATPVSAVYYVDLRQSMRNGGGPACLRLRVPMSRAQCDALATTVNVTVTDGLLDELRHLIVTHYPEQLSAANLARPDIVHASRQLLDQLLPLLRLPALIPPIPIK